MLSAISDQIMQAKETGCEICVVVGGGNFWRGRQGTNMDRTTADYMGMLATTMNALALQDALEQKGAQVRCQTAIEMRQMAEPYVREACGAALRKKAAWSFLLVAQAIRTFPQTQQRRCVRRKWGRK